MNEHLIEKGMSLILDGLGVNRKDRNFADTPERYARALKEMFEPKETEWAAFPEQYSDFILIRDHRMYSLCPHHMFPVRLYVSIAYVPNGHVVGLSKLPRMAAECNRGPLLQEAFTREIVTLVERTCHPKGVACLVEGRHGCMEMRGVKSDAHTLTYKFSGTFHESDNLQNRFLNLCKTPRL